MPEKLLPKVRKLEVDFRTDRVFLTWEDGTRIQLESLSEGYLTTLSWVLDLLARWVEDRIARKQVIPPLFHKTMTGVVLVDDIDLHLHPLWQWRLVDDLRELFPLLTFVVTTHNPVTLLGAHPGELYVLRRQGDSVQMEPRDIPPGTDVSQVLTGAWFGLAADVDRETLRLMESQRRLLRGDDPETPGETLEQVDTALRERLARRQETSVDRIAIEAAAEVIDEDLRTLTPEDKAEIQERVHLRLKEKGLH